MRRRILLALLRKGLEKRLAEELKQLSGSAPSIHVGASLYDVPERDEGDNYEKEGEEEDEDNDNEVIRGDTPKDEDN